MRTCFIILTGLICCGILSGCRASGDASPETHVVEIRQMKFVPERLQIAPGDSVRWINRDIVAHNVATERPARWRSADLQTGDSFAVRVEEAETYTCTLHPVMKGTITF